MGQVTSPSAFRLSPSSLSFLLHPFLLAPDVPLTSPSSHQQELVNLLLTGKAVSNVFNDVVELDSGDGDVTLLKGIAARSDIGFLSLFEHYNVCQVPRAQVSGQGGARLPRTQEKERGGGRVCPQLPELGGTRVYLTEGLGRVAASLPSATGTEFTARAS